MLNPMFSMGNINQRVDNFVIFKEERIRLALHYVGVDFMDRAKENLPRRLGGTSFEDHTGNLRSSIGYAVLLDGEVLDEEYKVVKGGQEGANASRELVRELATEFNKGFVLIGLAGMEYAAAVESKGYDVITGSTPMADELLTFFKKELRLL